jgi:uncharacterized membrane protein
VTSAPSDATHRAADTIRENVRTIAELEAQYAGALSRTDVIGRHIARIIGTLTFALVHAALFALWTVWNSRAPARLIFDPFPFGMLALIVSVEGVLLATFILIAQNRESKAADRRSHLGLQVSLLIEQELTAVLRTLATLGENAGVRPQAIKDELLQETQVSEVLEQIEEQITSEPK